MNKEKLLSEVENAIDEAVWYFKCSGTQSEHNSDLSLEELYMEDSDQVLEKIYSLFKEYYQDILKNCYTACEECRSRKEGLDKPVCNYLDKVME